MSQEDVNAINAHTDDAVKRVLEAMNEHAAREREQLKTRLSRLRKAIDKNASRDEVKQLIDDLAETIQHPGRPNRMVGETDTITS